MTELLAYLILLAGTGLAILSDRPSKGARRG